MVTVPATQPSVFDRDPAAEVIELPPEQDAYPPVSREEMIDRFSRLLGMSELPKSEWRAVGDFEVLDETVRATVQWMHEGQLRRRRSGAKVELPVIPHVQVTLPDSKMMVTRPAEGTRSVFDACVAGAFGGLTPAQVQSSWNTAKRRVLQATRGIGGLRGSR